MSAVASEESRVFSRRLLVFLLAAKVVQARASFGLRSLSERTLKRSRLLVLSLVFTSPPGAILDANKLISEAPCGCTQSHAGL